MAETVLLAAGRNLFRQFFCRGLHSYLCRRSMDL